MDDKKGATEATAFVFISSPLFLLTLPLARPQIVSLCQNKKYSIWIKGFLPFYMDWFEG